jgi:hypothetical protein
MSRCGLGKLSEIDGALVGEMSVEQDLPAL